MSWPRFLWTRICPNRDARLIAGASDAALFAARHGVTRAGALQHAEQHLERADLRVIVSILNAFNPQTMAARTSYRYQADGRCDRLGSPS